MAPILTEAFAAAASGKHWRIAFSAAVRDSTLIEPPYGWSGDSYDCVSERDSSKVGACLEARLIVNVTRQRWEHAGARPTRQRRHHVQCNGGPNAREPAVV